MLKILKEPKCSFHRIVLGHYLGKSITAPIVRLANEADKIADNKILKTINLPEFELRKDEIGDLARSFSKMTNELQSRINYISDFTADVAHELKNPITSLRSASETIGKIKDLKEQKKFN